MATISTDQEAFQAILAHHGLLHEAVATRVAAVTRDVADGVPGDASVAELVGYIRDEVLPHARAEENSIYEVAARRPELVATVTEMIAEHGEITAATERLDALRSNPAAAETAAAIGTLFAQHAAKENDVLLPPLVADQGVDMVELLDRMHRLTEAAHDELPTFDSSGDPELDVRALAPAQRHGTIFATHRALRPGAGFVLVNDHDPKPLSYQFEAEYKGEFTWDYLESGPRRWRVRIGRP